MINLSQLREFIIRPAMSDLSMGSTDAEELLVFTCAVESSGGTYIKQIKGPALGVFQMEPETYHDIWRNYIMPNSRIIKRMSSKFDASVMPDAQRLIYDLRFSAAMARLLYARVSEPLPSAHDIDSIWDYFKKYYNTVKGTAKKTSSIKKYYTYLNS